jgi:hypothetical protein
MEEGKLFIGKNADLVDSPKYHYPGVHPINTKGGGEDGKQIFYFY